MTKKNKTPVRETRLIIEDSGDPGYVNRLLVATPSTGLVRMEWVGARYGMIIPVNWSMVQLVEFVSGYVPMRYQVADAQNLCVMQMLDKDFEWLLLLEHDTMPPPDMLIRLNQYMRDEPVPVVSGLYYTRSRPSEPLVFRGRGNSVFTDWKMGDRVWVDGLPTGCLLVHRSILELMWAESPEYNLNGRITRRVFDTPRDLWVSPETGYVNTTSGTSDLDWSTRVVEGDYIRRAGWNEYWDKLPDKRYPLLIDTAIFCRHIDMDGTIYP